MTAPDFRTSLPALGRIETGLSAVELEIVHGSGVIKMDANSAIGAAYYESLELGDPVLPSTLSGQPGYLLRTCEMQLVFTKEELYRLLRRDLQPAEYFKLRRQFGEFYEVHDDFYDETTGRALASFQSASAEQKNKL